MPELNLIGLIKVFLTSRQPREKLLCLYENLVSNSFRKTAVLRKNMNFKLNLHS